MFWEYSFVFIIFIPKWICVIVVLILELSIRCSIIYRSFILLDNISCVNNARFQTIASKWTAVFISAIAWMFFAIWWRGWNIMVMLFYETYYSRLVRLKTCDSTSVMIWWCLDWKFCRDSNGLGNAFLLILKRFCQYWF